MKGEIYALLAALTWGCALVLFKRGVQEMSPLVLNFFKNSIALVLLTLTLLCGVEVWNPFQELSSGDWLIFAVSGILGLTVADSLFLAGLQRIGVTLISIVDCLYSPSILFFSWMLLGEAIGVSHWVGAGMIIFGILISTQKLPSYGVEEIDKKDFWSGVVLGVAGILTMAFAIVIVKKALQRTPLFWATTIRLVFGNIALFLWLLFRERTELKSLLRPKSSWGYPIAASFLGSYLAMIFWIGGFKYTKASIAGLLNQSSLVFAIILSVLFLKESMTRRRFLAVLFASAGTLVVALRPF